jgi:hypothetical protein
MISVTTNSLPFEGKKGVGGIRSVDSVGLGRCSVQVHRDERPGVELVVATCQHRTKLAALPQRNGDSCVRSADDSSSNPIVHYIDLLRSSSGGSADRNRLPTNTNDELRSILG